LIIVEYPQDVPQPALFILFRYERAEWQCISVSTAMTTKNAVTPTFEEEKRAPR